MAKNQPMDPNDGAVVQNNFEWFLKRMGYEQDKLSGEFIKALEEAFYGGATSVMLLIGESEQNDTELPTRQVVLEELRNYWSIENIKDLLKID